MNELALSALEDADALVEQGRRDVSPNGSSGGRPTPDRAMFYGLAGEVVDTIDPHTEADPVAVLVTFLTGFGAIVGSGPHMVADGARHPARLYVVIAGRTAKARKGSSWENVQRVLEAADPSFWEDRVLGGLGSGEALIDAVADGPGPTDRRVLIYEPEFARVLAVAGRDGSTLSTIIRQAWESGKLRVMTRKDPRRAKDAHVAFLAHVTVEELRRHLSETEMANGFANRFLFVAAERSKLLPSGGHLDDEDFSRLSRLSRASIEEAREAGRMRRSPDAEKLWEYLYGRLAEEETPGLLGAITARGDAQVLRLSLTYALTDGSNVIDVPHLEAAWALWRYAFDSAQEIFGQSTGWPDADRLLAAIENAGGEGLPLTRQGQVFGGHRTARQLQTFRSFLEDRSLIETTSFSTDGRNVTVSYGTAGKAGKARKGSGRR